MDWGFGNPNRTAAFIAIVILALWILPWIKKQLFWFSFPATAFLGIALVHTLSRGGMVAFAVGLLPLLYWSPKPWARSKILLCVATVWIILVGAIVLKADERFLNGASSDRSITNRLDIWKMTPAMMVDAPFGWGIGNAANAYQQWYQPLDRNEGYLNLVNSHLTWLVEFGWPARIAYVLAWTLTFFVCWPRKETRWYSVSLAVWLAFFVSAIFTHVASIIWIWTIPGVLLGSVILHRILSRRFLSLQQVAAAIAITALVSACIFILGKASPILYSNNRMVSIGSDPSMLYVLYDSKTMGTLYGKAIRKAFFKLRVPICISLSSTLPSSLTGKIVVLGATLPTKKERALLEENVKNCAKLILLNPDYPPGDLGLNPADLSKVIAYFGDFSQSAYLDSWKASTVRQLSGAGDFVPDWPTIVLTSITDRQNP